MVSKPPRCPYCGESECTWTLSPVAGQTGAEVHTACGHAIMADNLLGKSRWHLEAAQRAIYSAGGAGADTAKSSSSGSTAGRSPKSSPPKSP